MRRSPRGDMHGDKRVHMPPSLISLHLFCFLPPIFIGQWHNSGIKDFFFVSFFLLQLLSVDYYNNKSHSNCSHCKGLFVSLACSRYVLLLRKDRETLLSALFCNISCRSGSLIQINSISVGTTLLECGYNYFIARLVEPNDQCHARI